MSSIGNEATIATCLAGGRHGSDVPTTRSGIQSISRAAAVLKELSQSPQGRSVLDLAMATGLDRTTVHRLVRTLATTGLVEARGAIYRVGPTCLALGVARINSLNLREAALPYAVDLQQSVVKNRPLIVSLSAAATDEVVIVDRIWTPAVPLSIIMGIGWRFPIDETVSGRAMLATLSDAEIDARIGNERRKRLMERLTAIRERDGLEWGMGEFHAGVGTIACPLLGTDGTAVGAIIVAGLGMEAELNQYSDLSQSLRRSAQMISRLLKGSR